MALLSSADELRVYRGLMRYWSRDGTRETTTNTKGEILAAVQAINVYLDGAGASRPATSINAAYPVAFRNAATTPMKGLTVAAIALAQTGNMALLRQVIGEVDG